VIPIGTSEAGPVYLTGRELKTHLHCMGTSQLGKSRLIEHICTQLLIQRKGFMLLDPHGKLYQRVLRRFALLGFLRDDVTLFDPSAQSPHGFDPFRFEGDEDELFTRARMLAQLTLQVWGIENPTDRPRFDNWLFNLYHTLIEQKLSLSEALSLLRYDAPIPGGRVRDEWEELHHMRRSEFQTFVEPLRSRFRGFTHPRLQRIFAKDTIDLEGIIDRKGVLLASLNESRVLGEQENKTLAALFIGYIWRHVLSRKEPTDFYVIIDEFQMFATETVASILDQSAKFGLHMMLFHQREGHMSRNLTEAMTNASARIVFTGERRFTLNGLEVEAPHVPDLDKNPALDAITERYVAAHAPLPEAKPSPTIERPEQEYDQPPMRYIKPTDHAEIVLDLCYATVEHVATLTGDDSEKRQNTAKKLRALAGKGTLKKLAHGGRSVYCAPDAPEKHLAHELAITDLHILLWDHLTHWEQSGLKGDGINPDAFFATHCHFFLEMERANPRSQDGEAATVRKAKQYAAYADARLHKPRCENFRVLFVMPTEKKAHNFTKTLSGLPNPGRFWLSWGGTTAIDTKGVTHSLTTPDTTD
jgi:hypothetical protein